MVHTIEGYRRISKALLWISMLGILIRAFFLIYLMGVRQLFSKIQSRLIGFVFISDFKGVGAFGRRFKSFSDNDCDGLIDDEDPQVLDADTWYLDFDGDADQDDTTKLVQDILNTNYGDANLDLSVDLADFNTWLASAGGGWAGADFNGDASIDLADFNIWLTTVPPDAPLLNAVPVPEPTTMAMFGLVGLLAAGRRRLAAPGERTRQNHRRTCGPYRMDHLPVPPFCMTGGAYVRACHPSNRAPSARRTGARHPFPCPRKVNCPMDIQTPITDPPDPLDASFDIVARQDALEENVATIRTDLDEVKARVDRIGRAAQRPALGSGDSAPAEVKGFVDGYLRRGNTHEFKSIAGTSPSDGGYAVPRQIDAMIARQLTEISPIRALAQVVQTGSAGYRKLVTTGGTASGWAGETAERPETDTPSFAEIAPPSGDLYANPAASQAMLDDAGFDLGE